MIPRETLVVPLPPPAAAALRELARAELRTPQLQVSWLVQKELKRRGLVADVDAQSPNDRPRDAA